MDVVRVQQELARSLGEELALVQCQQGYQRLKIVPKHLYRGPRQGLFYVNQRGKRVYLNAAQHLRLQDSRIPGVVAPPGGNPPFHAAEIPESVFLRVDRQLVLAQQL